MNDQLKKYIDDNRDEFDHLEPSPAIFTQIMEELKAKPKAKITILSLFNNHKWVAAAAVFVVLFTSYLLFNKSTTNQPILQPQPSLVQHQQLTAIKPAKTAPEKVAPFKKEPYLVKVKANKTPQPIDMPSVYSNLTDSSSASKRLSAILQIQKLSVMNNDIIDRLAKTLNHDPNSNVRLAVLDLLGNYADYGYVTSVFVQSLSTQKDPSVQLGLINLLAKTNNTKLDEKLYALATDPSTAAEVKDQAYLILLNQNKL